MAKPNITIKNNINRTRKGINIFKYLFLMLWKITDGRVINKWYKITKVKVFTNTDSKDGVFWIQIPKIANIRNIITKTFQLISRVRRSLFLFSDFCCFVNENWKLTRTQFYLWSSSKV